MSPTTRTLQVADGTTISFTVIDGQGPTIVLLHGLAGSGRELMPTATAMAGRRVIVIDQRGHGRSTRTPANVERRQFVADVTAVIARAGRGPVDLVGHSMGAHTALLVASEQPQLVRRLVLLECTADGSPSESVDDLVTWMTPWPRAFTDIEHARAHLGDGVLAEAMLADLYDDGRSLRLRFDPEVMFRIMQTLTEPRWAEWRKVTAPTLAIFAERGMFSEEDRAAFVDAGRRVERVDLAGASHDAHLDGFQPWATALGQFLDTP